MLGSESGMLVTSLDVIEKRWMGPRRMAVSWGKMDSVFSESVGTDPHASAEDPPRLSQM